MELPELYAERSPITYVDRVRAPVLLLAGEHDSACPIRQVRHYARRLGRRGGDVELYVYPAGHHATRWPSSSAWPSSGWASSPGTCP